MTFLSEAEKIECAYSESFRCQLGFKFVSASSRSISLVLMRVVLVVVVVVGVVGGGCNIHKQPLIFYSSVTWRETLASSPWCSLHSFREFLCEVGKQ